MEESKITLFEHSFGGNWTLIKLEALEKYLSAFNSALSNQRFSRIYIDAFAGTGSCDITINGLKSTIDGSAKIALDTTPSFHKFYFIELQLKKIAALKKLTTENIGKQVQIIEGDANHGIKEICALTNWKNTRAVLFLDPYGMHVDWATLEAIAKTEAIDVWYLFPYSGLYRQAPKDGNALGTDKEEAITRLLGTDAWKQSFYEKKRQSSLFDEDVGDERTADHQQMLAFVSKRLASIFPSVSKPKILYQGSGSDGPMGAPLFALYFAAANKSPKAYSLAMKIANDVLKFL